MLSTDADEAIVLRRRANIRAGRGRAVGTLFVTTRRLSFRPLSRARRVDIDLEDIESVATTGIFFKKMRVCTADATYTMFMKKAANVVSLVRTLMDVPSAAGP
ncbi:MAG: PH domain-containing protein [Thermoplasmatota archaeon]